jgi:DNA-binding transcriptional LysR family regulator
VARKGNVSEAARVLGRRQPTISQQIKNLEEHYNVILFDRSKGRMALTPEGQEVFAHAIDVFESVREISDKLSDSSGYGSIDYFSGIGPLVAQ